MAGKNGQSKPPVLQAASALEWRQLYEGVVIPLSIGLNVRIRPVTIDTMIRWGRIPDSLTPLIISIVQSGVIPDMRDFASLLEIRGYFEFYDALAMSCIIEPRVVDKPEHEVDPETEIHVSWIPIQDKYDLLELLSLPARELARFRDQQIERVAALQAGAASPPAAESGDEHTPVGDVADGVGG